MGKGSTRKRNFLPAKLILQKSIRFRNYPEFFARLLPWSIVYNSIGDTSLGTKLVHIKKHLGFTGLRKTIAKHSKQVDDQRQASKVGFAIHDCLMSGFAMMFFQDRFLLSFQRRMSQKAELKDL